MRLNKIRRNDRLYVKLLIGITLSIVIAVFICSSIYYFTFARILQNEAFESNLANLQQTGKTVAKMTDSAQTVAFQIYRNSTISKLLYYNNPNPFDTQAAMIDLNNYLVTMPYIHSIYVYNPLSGRYYITSQNGQKGIIPEDQLMDQSITQILDHYKDYQPFTPIPRLISMNEQSEDGTSVYTYLCYDAVGVNQRINSAVIVNISASWINQDLNQQLGGNDQTLYIDDRNSVLNANDLSPVTLSDVDYQAIEHLLQFKESGYRVASFEGAKSLITYTAPDPYNWQYVRITPYSEITKKLSSIRLRTLLIASVVLAVGVFLAWLVSKFLYVPIHKIENQMRALESEKRNSSYTLRQNTMRKLLHIHDFNAEMQAEKLKKMGITFDFMNPYRLAYVRIDQFDLLKQENHKDLLTYKFAIMNIATEICSRQYTVDSIDLDDDSLVMLINTFEDQHEIWEDLELMLKDIQNACMEYIRIGLTIALTPVSKSPRELQAMYKLAKEASNQRFFAGRGAIIEAGPLQSHNKYSFPIGKEKRLIEALAAGKIEEAKALFDTIMQETVGYSYSVAHAAATHISVTLDNMLMEIERNGSIQLCLGTELIIPRIEQYETLEEMTNAFHQFFDLLKSKFVEKRSSKQDDLIRKINEIITSQFDNASLSLNYVADELKMSSYHISRVYRQQTMTTIVDTINAVRIEKSKELLVATELSVTEIAERTGYTNSSYFHRIFKKIIGVTPSEFRKANQGLVK
ncbi:AraC-like DNA-binding protein [Paenibacillus cellulosilyticus]|uniref:AraC-like DNA-binding protein n=1 Tax=Paenibacillus cellulosilyticus TaxID=375489 RepID=A0A2V2YS94_9BACL|nr:helix-turn-helix domain-containing protein [Paenibacillus cellulosilyticus]PWW00973.1 AraC-like DNA-binding protein [Paenibacillus cellulosilyticus]QKS47617.1 AraC family transcriptional regulator [Paenibacillus cellulosilyticus]